MGDDGDGDGGVTRMKRRCSRGASLVPDIASRHVLRGTRVPNTVALLILGITMGSIEYGTSIGLGKLGASICLYNLMRLR